MDKQIRDKIDSNIKAEHKDKRTARHCLKCKHINYNDKGYCVYCGNSLEAGQ